MLRRRLLWRLFLSYLAITLAILFFAGWFSTRELRRFYREQSKTRLQAGAQLIVQQVLPLTQNRDDARIQPLCRDLGRVSATRVTVIRRDGKVLGDSDADPARMDNHLLRPEIQQALRAGAGWNERYSDTLKQRMLYYAVALPGRPEPAGWVRTALPVRVLDQSLNAIYRRMAWGGALVVALAGLIGLLISTRISQPLELMKFGALRFATGDLNYRLPAFTTDEMNSLASSMNRMAAELSEKIKLLEHHRYEEDAVLSSMTEGVLAFDREQRLILINPAALNLLGVERERAMGLTLKETVREKKLRRLIRKTLKTGSPAEDDLMITRGGQPHLFRVTGRIWKDREENLLGAFIVMRDITRLQILENMRRDFVANVSHELMTPITNIKGFIETLQEGAKNNPEDADRFLRIVQRNADRLRSIIEDLLALSRIEQDTGENKIDCAPCKMREVLDEALQLCREQAEARQIKIKLECEETLKPMINPRLIQQALINLVQNAIKYSPNQSEVIVQAHNSNLEVRINVIDQGIGIDKKHHQRLFERFYRVDVARSRSLGGTGLGLAIVKHIALAHGGTVEVQSEPGKGSTFTIVLPIKSHPPAVT